MNSRLKDQIRSIRDYLPKRLNAWRRRNQLSTDRKHYSKADLITDLENLPLPNDGVVLLHSSLKAIGFVEGGPDVVIDALVETIVRRRDNTLMLPTYSINGTMRNSLATATENGGVAFDALKTPSNLGAIPEAFRRYPGVARSVHPTHSFAAIGPLAGQLVDGHHTCGSSFGPGSPMANVLEHDGWLLGLGTNLGNVTFYHCLEDIEPDFPFQVYSPDSPFEVCCRDSTGTEHRLTLNAHDENVSRTRIDRPENEAIRKYYTQQLEDQAGMTWHRVCEADCWLVSTAQFYKETRDLMRTGITIYSTQEQLLESGRI